MSLQLPQDGRNYSAIA